MEIRRKFSSYTLISNINRIEELELKLIEFDETINKIKNHLSKVTF